jgi:YHS domain-containing protein
MTKDPVCGMEVENTKAAIAATYQKQSFYFCSETADRRAREEACAV